MTIWKWSPRLEETTETTKGDRSEIFVGCLNVLDDILVVGFIINCNIMLFILCKHYMWREKFANVLFPRTCRKSIQYQTLGTSWGFLQSWRDTGSPNLRKRLLWFRQKFLNLKNGRACNSLCNLKVNDGISTRQEHEILIISINKKEPINL